MNLKFYTHYTDNIKLTYVVLVLIIKQFTRIVYFINIKIQPDFIIRFYITLFTSITYE